VTWDAGGFVRDVASSVAESPDSSLVVVGTTYSREASGNRFFLLKGTRDGVRDHNFGRGGAVIANFGVDAFGNAIARTVDRQMIAVGYTTSVCAAEGQGCERTPDVALARITTAP
jgi:hypothetical protein